MEEAEPPELTASHRAAAMAARVHNDRQRLAEENHRHFEKAKAAPKPPPPPPAQAQAARVVPDVPEGSITSDFEQFHAANPHVYNELVALCRQAKEAGRPKVGMGQLFEVLRWNRNIQSGPSTEFSLNNNFRSRYVRLIRDQEPDLAGMFEVRKLKSI